MVTRKISYLAFAIVVVACTKDVGRSKLNSDYPDDIAEIVLSKCAVPGCHNSISKDAAAGLSLANWKELFEGSRGGSAVIPYRPDFSTLCYYTNSFSELGPVLEPRMPVNGEDLTREEYLKLTDWIKAGAPDNKGNVKFSNSGDKWYVTNQLCDIVTVLDAESKLPMRYVNVGVMPKTEFPVCIKSSADKKYWYVSFLASAILQKFDAVNDVLLSQVNLGAGTWSTFSITEDSKFAFCVDNNMPGKIAYVDLKEMKVVRYYENPGFMYPGSAALHNKSGKLYVGTESGNYLSILNTGDTSTPVKQLILDGSAHISHEPSIDPGFVYVEESLDLCIIACRGSREIKIIDILKDSVIHSLYLGTSPTSFDLIKSQKKLLITCNEDSVSFPGQVGSVKVVDLISGQIVKLINSGYQPNGICVNELRGYASVVNSNISPKGPRPHHTGGCSGRNGYMTFIDLKTLDLIPNTKYELAVYPYAITLRK